MMKIYLSRAQTRAMSADHPIGDPTGGVAYGEKNDPVTAAIVGVGGSLLGSSMQSDAAQGAADTSSAASKYAADLQKQMYDQTRTDQAPWRETGVQGLNSLKDLMGFNGMDKANAAMQYDPNYQWQLQQGEQGLNRAAAASGRYDSGAALKSLMNYNRGAASAAYGDRYNRLASMAGLGQTANQSLQQAGTGYANNVGNLMMTNAANQGNAGLVGANARASGYQAAGNALGNLMGNWNSGQNFGTAWNYGTSPGSQQTAMIAAQNTGF